ncbi:DUF4752 family protein [Escherichia coli]|uniref:DUF4752 family protein n=1 Tax=Escherichia coli TaxID=562 RepID=UPI001C40719E|nr:DUF4752 family protein [Escherichia coli]
MNIDTTITLDTALNTGLALLGWVYIMFSAVRWVKSVFLKQWDKLREKSRRQQAVDEFCDAFSLECMEPGSTIRIATKEDLIIMMYRQEKANDRTDDDKS